MVLIHGILDTWRTWELVLPALEREHDVLALTMPGHAGGPPLGEDVEASMLDPLEAAMDEAGFDTAHIVGNSLGGYIALHLAARGRARGVVALNPAGGWMPGEDRDRGVHEYFKNTFEAIKQAAPFAEAVMATPEGRRGATQFTTVNYEHIPAELLVHQLQGAAACHGFEALTGHGLMRGTHLEPEKITCPVRVVVSLEDRILPPEWGQERYRTEWLPNADWIELENVGHCPQLDVPAETAQLILDFTR